MLPLVLPIPPVSTGSLEVGATDIGLDKPRGDERRSREGFSLEVKTGAMAAGILALVAVAAVTVLGSAPGWVMGPILAFATGLVIAVYRLWVFKPIAGLIRRSRSRLGESFEDSDPRYNDELRELGYLVNTLIAVFTAAEDKEWVSQAVTEDLMRIQQTKRQLLDVGEIGTAINAALPYRETVDRALMRVKAFLRADVVVLIGLDAQARAFRIEGSLGLELDEPSADCCAFTTGCPVRRSAGTAQVVRSTDHSCGLLPPTLSAQTALPVAVDGVGMFVLLAAATAWDHFGELGDDVLVALRGHLQNALGNAHRYDAIRRQVTTDHLTGLHNRRYFVKRAAEEIERSLRYQQPLSVLMIDIDHFKTFNDRYGHATGDKVLQAVAGVLKAAFRGVDICARLGGEEFAILLPNTPGDNAYHVAERVRRTLGGTRYTGLGLPPEVNITISVGVATCPRDATSLDELLDLADKALYGAKSEGRDLVRQHARGLREEIRR